MPEITLKGYRCERCGHVWVPRLGEGEKPTICPKCKSPYWDRPRRNVDPVKQKAVIRHFKQKGEQNA